VQYRSSVGELVTRVVAVALGAVILAVAFVFSLVVFSIALAAGLVALGYVWWKTRSAPRAGGRVIEGEARRESPPQIDRDER
jgi:Ca2+/Na+ antiporter